MRLNRYALALIATLFSSCATAPRVVAPDSQFADCKFCPEMIKIAAGTYSMGDAIGDGQDNERPPQSVVIDKPFAMSKYPITLKQFRAFADASGYASTAERLPDEGCWGIKDDLNAGWLAKQSWRTNNLKQRENHPVVCVSWDDANAYAQWLSHTTGFHYRLPSEAEWEYAARAGARGKYYFGDDANRVCEHINHADHQMVKAWAADTGVSPCDDGYLTTSPVGSFPANRFGLYDTYGNVWEWVADCDQSHPPATIPTRPADNTPRCRDRTLRGASWASLPLGITNSYRINAKASVRTVDYGFRVLREL